MDENFLLDTPLFRGAPAEELPALLDCLEAVRRRFPKGGMVCRAGEPVQALGLVLSGSVHIENNDLWGNRSILDRAGPGQVFAEAYACIPGEPLMVGVVASEPTEILFLKVGRLFRADAPPCAHRGRLIQNLLAISAQKNLALSRRIFHTSSKTIRGRLLSYLSFQAARQGACDFSIPFDRQQLADYLDVDRSALSAELGKLRREGLLTAEKNRFHLKPGL